MTSATSAQNAITRGSRLIMTCLACFLVPRVGGDARRTKAARSRP